MSRRPIFLKPKGARDVGWVYVLGTPGGLVKVGFTSAPGTRLRDHHSFYGGLAWCHVFPPVARHAAKVMEIVAIHALAVKATERVGNEAFAGFSNRLEVISLLRAKFNACMDMASCIYSGHSEAAFAGWTWKKQREKRGRRPKTVREILDSLPVATTTYSVPLAPPLPVKTSHTVLR